MKEIIDGSLYDTDTAEKICERISNGPEFGIGTDVKKLKQLFKTRSGKYFFYTRKEFIGLVGVNDDDIFPEVEEMEVEDHKIIPIDYKLALEFVNEVSNNLDPKAKKRVAKYFPQIIDDKTNKNFKYQKKIYLSEKAMWYLEMMITESKDTNSSILERLIVEEYKRLYSQGIMNRDPYFEMGD